MQFLKLKKFHVLFFIIVVFFIVSGCITTESLKKKYAGYTVVRKDRTEVKEDVPVWIMSCVRPNGLVRCEVEAVGSYPSAGVNLCTLNCNEKGGDSWIKRQTGTQKQTTFKYIVKFKSPAGEVVEEKVNKNFFDEVQKGQVIRKTQ